MFRHARGLVECSTVSSSCADTRKCCEIDGMKLRCGHECPLVATVSHVTTSRWPAFTSVTQLMDGRCVMAHQTDGSPLWVPL
jgi:hypothetical protein